MDGAPHSRDLRKGRVSAPEHAYLVTTVTLAREPLLGDLWAARTLVRALRRHQSEGYAQTLAFVVMPDHLHWLMVLGRRRPLPKWWAR